MRPILVISGRPNVGKSTLFNRLLGKRRAIVHDRPGVTRDRLFDLVDIGGGQAWLVDTGGFLADKLLGTHRSMVIGGLIIAAGHFALAVIDLFPPGSDGALGAFFLGLILIAIGTGYFKPCVSVMVGQLYREKDPRRDA